MQLSKWKRNLLGSATMLGLFSIAAADPAEVHILPNLPGAVSSQPVDVNESGVILGNATMMDHSPTPILWIDEKPIEIPSDLLSPHASAINDDNVICGSGYSTTMGMPVPVIWHNGKETILPTTGPVGMSFHGGAATDINNNGDVVGYVYDIGSIKPVIWKNGVMHVLASDHYPFMWPMSIDDDGVVSGFATNPITMSAVPVQWIDGLVTQMTMGPGMEESSLQTAGFVTGSANPQSKQSVVTGWLNTLSTSGTVITPTVWRNQILRPLDLLSPSGQSQAMGTNNRGQIFGFSTDSVGYIAPVVWTAEGAHRLPAPGQAAIALNGNENGMIVGTGYDSNHNPVPLMWKMPEVTMLSMPNMQIMGTNTATIRVVARRGSTPVAGATTEFRVNNQRVGLVRTGADGAASITIPTRGMNAGRQEIMASLGGSRYILRRMVMGVANTDTQALAARARQGQRVTLRGVVNATDLDRPLANRRVQVLLNNRAIGRVMTNAEGVAEMTFAVPRNLAAGAHRVMFRFDGDGQNRASRGTATLTVSR